MTSISPNTDIEGPTTNKPEGWVDSLTSDDAAWILTSSFIIFTMQTGFGMLECGCVASKNEVNIMMKNVVDVVFGGLTYWLFGYSLSFGKDRGSSPVLGIGDYAVDSDYDNMGQVLASFMFQLSFATTATTIVSGCMAERCNFKSYCVFSMLNTIVYCVPARWMWGPGGFLAQLGCIDIAGSGGVHLLGGVSGYVAAWMLGPRYGRYEHGTDPLPLGNPTNCVVGLCILWWYNKLINARGWLPFNSGSTFGVSKHKWKFAARAAVSTLVASLGGGLFGSCWTLRKPGRIFQVMDIVNPILGALVGVTAGCALYHTHDAFLVGIISGAVVVLTAGFADYTRVDDPVGAVAVHAFGGAWGLLAVGLFAEDDEGTGFSSGHAGIFRGGSFYLLGVQLLAIICIVAWAVGITVTLLWTINKIVPIRMEPYEQLLGADFVEHLVRRRQAGISPALSAVGSHAHVQEVMQSAAVIGINNPTHDTILQTIDELNVGVRWKLRNAASAIKKTTFKIKSAKSRLTDSTKVTDLDQTSGHNNGVIITEHVTNTKKSWNCKTFWGNLKQQKKYKLKTNLNTI